MSTHKMKPDLVQTQELTVGETWNLSMQKKAIANVTCHKLVSTIDGALESNSFDSRLSCCN